MVPVTPEVEAAAAEATPGLIRDHRDADLFDALMTEAQAGIDLLQNHPELSVGITVHLGTGDDFRMALPTNQLLDVLRARYVALDELDRRLACAAPRAA